MDKKFIQNRISELKDYNNYSEYQLSYELGKSKGYIQSITSGRSLPSMQVFLDLCDCFEITPSEFFSDDSLQCNSQTAKRISSKLSKLSQNDLEILEENVDRFLKT